MQQVEMICLEDLVPESHNYRKFAKIWSFSLVEKRLKKLEKNNPHKGYGLLRLFKCLLLQFMENCSDRELERFIQENNAARWFCGFNLRDNTPDHTVFCQLRKKIGTNTLSKVFADLRDQLKRQGLMSEVFTFVDATHLIAKANLWEERDKAIAEKYEKLNNENISQFSADAQAKIGCKGKNKYWYGYKKHASVDMQTGLINKVAITPANITDASGFKHVCPTQGSGYMDKGYCINPAPKIAKAKGVHLCAIKKNTMKRKNKDQDRWYSSVRAPYERVFSQREKRVRYRGIAKNQFAAFMQAICYNLKRLTVLDPPNLCLL
ncbi:MAG: transposase [Simkaniaceae bacterium]|nr:MAG: transposase [Simkaniaceae bacterium]QVL55666.1 MAG: transposase [Simkaniaceae bacterium]QVL55960.1 MAG: transposase [Simkaniaceae bacterium]QVL56058.1 MAG: transposase [Simkaniaceae bacterium]QVL56093.1 MAG: transposase [Simkaniaceae bacterium]